MRMGFDVHPDDASRLSRSPLLVRRPGVRPRYRTVRIVWHDSQDMRLRAQGLALAEQNHRWSLERLTPGEDPWLPTQAPPESARALIPEELGHALPDDLGDDLAVIAAFDGRAAVSLLETAGGPVSMEVLRGETGAVPLVRLTLDGDDVAVRDLALALSGVFRVQVPRASLAAAAIAIARGESPPPRRLGAPEAYGGLSVPDAFAHAIGHFTDVLLHFAARAVVGGPDVEPVHQMRVAMRRARSAIAAFKHGLACPEVLAADEALRSLGKVLGPARDWDVFVTETLPRVITAFLHDRRLGRLATAAQQQREACNAALQVNILAPSFRQLGVSLAWLCVSNRWHAGLSAEQQVVSAMEPKAYAAHVLQRRWKKVVAAGRSIETLDVPSLHGLRLRAKRARYAMEIFLPDDHGKPAQRLIRRLSALQQHLGTLNDGAVAAGLLETLGGPTGRHGYANGVVLGYLAASAGLERPRITRAWEKFRRTPRFWS